MLKEKSESNWIPFLIPLSIIAVVGLITAASYYSAKHTMEAMLSGAGITRAEIIYDINDPWSEVKVREYLIQLHVKYPEVAIAQMKLESANGTSKVFREGNNLFGSKVAIRRPTTALGEKNNHAYYSHWRMSCVDYAIWQAFVSNTENMDSQENWLQFVGRMYAEDESYLSKIKHILANKQYKQTIK